MLTDDLRNKLIELMKTNPQEAIKELKDNPKFLEILLASDTELKKAKEELSNEKVKYVNMTSTMQKDLKEQAEKLNTTQGLLIGVGLLWFLKLLSEEK